VSALPCHVACLVDALTAIGVAEPVARDAAGNLLAGMLALCGDVCDRRGLMDDATWVLWHAVERVLSHHDREQRGAGCGSTAGECHDTGCPVELARHRCAICGSICGRPHAETCTIDAARRGSG